jgi:hypothetical protein
MAGPALNGRSACTPTGATKPATTRSTDEARRQFDQNVEHTERDRRLCLFELSVDQSDLPKTRELLKHPLLKEEARVEADPLRVRRARVVFELRDKSVESLKATERMTEIARGFSNLGLQGEVAATAVLLSRHLLETGETVGAMNLLADAEGAALTAGDHYLQGVAAWGWAEAFAQQAQERSGGMDPIIRTRYENRIMEARAHLDQAGRPEAALLGRSPPKLVVRLSDLWPLRDPWPG